MNKSNTKNIVIVVLSILVVVLLIVTIYQNFFSGRGNTPPLEEPDKDLVVSVEDFVAFDLEDVPFKFVVATVKFSSNEAIDIKLNNIRTNENVELNAVDQYRKAIEDKGYDLSLMEVATADLVSLDNTLTTNLFIPVKSINANQIQLVFSESLQNTLKVKINPVVIDISNATGTETMLGKVSPEEPDIDLPSENAIVFGEIGEIDAQSIFKENAEGELQSPDYPSVVRIFALPVSISSDTKVGIEEARFTIDSSNETFYALGSEAIYQFGNNVIGDNDFYYEGVLIFEVTSQNPYWISDREPITVEYRLIGQEDWTLVNDEEV